MKKHFSLLLLTSVIALSLGAVDYKVNPLDARNILEEAYSSIWNAGFLIPESETELIKNAKGAPTYGEIVWDSAAELFAEIKITKKDVFYDLGCGTGKMAAQAWMSTPAKKVVGVDLSATRLSHARSVKDPIIENAKKVLGKKKFKKKQWEYREENIVETDIADATVVYMCSTCYSEELMAELTEKFTECKDGLRVLTLKQLAPHRNFKLVKTFTLPMTWSSGSPVYYYKLDKTGKNKKEKIHEVQKLAKKTLRENTAAPTKEIA